MAPKRRHVSSRVGIIAKIRKNRNFDGKKKKDWRFIDFCLKSDYKSSQVKLFTEKDYFDDKIIVDDRYLKKEVVLCTFTIHISVCFSLLVYYSWEGIA